MHRDLKPQNLFVNSNCELVLGDLGLARFHSSLLPHDDVDMSTSAGIGLGASAPSADLTSYVVTRWYRAPELLVSATSYGPAVDVWSVGVVVAEMLLRRPLLPGRSFTAQLQLTLERLGAPSDPELEWLRALPAYRAVRSQAAAVRASAKVVPPGGAPAPPAPPLTPLIALTRMLPQGTDPTALDLIARMLTFDPARRISVEDALEHPFMHDYHDEKDEPIGVPPPAELFAFDSRGTLTRAEIASMMMEEAARYGHPVPLEATAIGPRPTSTRMQGFASALPMPATAAEPPATVGGAGAAPVAAGAAPVDAIIAALTAQLGTMRTDLLAAVDDKVGPLVARLAALEEAAGAQHLRRDVSMSGASMPGSATDSVQMS